MRDLAVHQGHARVIEGRAVLGELGAGMQRLGRALIAELVVSVSVAITVAVTVVITAVGLTIGIGVVAAADEADG